MHAFYGTLGVSLLQCLHRRAQAVWPELTLERLREELQQRQQIELLYAGEGRGARPRVETVASSQSLAQAGLVAALGIERMLPAPAAKGAGITLERWRNSLPRNGLQSRARTPSVNSR